MERTMRPYADERLILQTGQGDIAALQRLFEQVYDAVYCYALSIVCDDWTAKCITEKTFLAVWENAGDYHVETNDALPWILNLCHWQAKTAEPVKSSERKNPFSKRLECPFMNQLLEGLPSRMRQVVILKAVMGLELHEIAKIVGGSVSGTGYRYTHGMIRLERDTSVIKLLSSMEEELCLEASKEIPEMTDGFLRQCEEIPQRRNRSGIIRLSSRLQPLRLAATSVLLLALLGTVGVYHAVNRQRSEITVTTENNMSLSVNGLDRVRSVVADNENKKAGANAAGSTLTEVMTSVTKEELDDESLSSDSNSMLVTVQESLEKMRELMHPVEAPTDDTEPLAFLRSLEPPAEDWVCGLNELKEALQDCSDQGIEELSIQDLAYLYYRRGLNLESVSLHGVPSEEKYLKGREAADKIFEKLNSDETWVDVFLTVWNNQLVYQVTVLQDGVKNIYEVNAESGDIVCVVIDDEETAADVAAEPSETVSPQPQKVQDSGTSGNTSSKEIDYSDIDTWLDQGRKIVKSATSSGSTSSKVSRIIRDASFGRINLNLG